MSADIIFYIDKTKNPKANPLLSPSNTSTDDSKLTFVGGDKVGIGVVFLTGNDIDVTMATGSIPKYLNLSLGTVGLDNPMAQVTNWYLSSSWGYTGSLDLATAAVTSSLTGTRYTEPTMQLIVSGSGGSRQTVMLRKVNLLNPVNIL